MVTIEIEFRPIQNWPQPFTPKRRPSPFKAGYEQSVQLLIDELAHLKVKRAVIQMAIPESQIRRDGLPFVQCRPEHPGVIVSFTGSQGPLSFPCDTFTRWQDNFRAIALALEALRKVDRYGVTRRGEQYTGWKALPPVGGTTSTLTAERAAQVVADLAEQDASLASRNSVVERSARSILHDRDAFQAAFRRAAHYHHPDKAGGDAQLFTRLTEAAAVLRKHHGLA